MTTTESAPTPAEAAESVLRAVNWFNYAMAGSKRRRIRSLRTPATINPDDRQKWRGHAGAYSPLGRDVEVFVRDAHNLGPRGKRATHTLTRTALEREIAALRAELGDIFPAPAEQPLPMVRFSQAGVQSVIGRAL